MTTYSDYFDAFLSSIEPDAGRLATAQGLLPEVRDHLKQFEGLRTIKPYTRLAGSYPRATAIGKLKDIDSLVFLDNSYRDGDPFAALVDLERALKSLPKGIGGGTAVTMRRQRRSIHLHFTNEDFHFDIVPVCMPDAIEEALYVPDWKLEKWVKTHPLGYQTWLSELNRDHSGKVVPLIKLAKQWRDCQFTYMRPKSYWLECLVVHSINEGWVQTKGLSYAEIFTALLDTIYDRFKARYDDPKAEAPFIKDPMLSNNVAWNWERGHFERFMGQVDESRNWAKRALAKEDAQEPEGVDLWQKVFNGTFPAVDTIRARQAQAAAKASSLYVNPSGHISTTPPNEGRAWQSPPHRFYGEDEK